MTEQTTTRKSIPIGFVSSEYKKFDRWAVIVGISKYEHTSLNLEYADRDAEELYKLLLTPNGGGFQSDHIRKLTNEEATTAKITLALRSFLKKPAREDLVIIYFACHGSPDPDRPNGDVYLLTYDTDPNEIAGTALLMDEIDRAIRNLYSEKVIILADACHSAAIGGSIGDKPRGINNSKVMNRFLQNTCRSKGGVALLTSTEANSVSFEHARWGGGHGVFTHYLLEGMRGAADRDNDGIVTIGELFEYVRDNVKESTGDKQHPFIGSNRYDRNMPIAISLNTNFSQTPIANLESLESCLRSHRWKEADLMTFAIMLKLSNCEDKEYLDVEDIQRLVFSDLQSIDELWTLYSNNHFGFSVQNKIWQNEPINGNPRSGLKEFRMFGNSVGWNEKREAVDPDPDGLAEEYIWHKHKNLNFSLQSPIGHLPWGGYGELGMSKRWRLGYLLLRFSQGKISSDVATVGKPIIESKIEEPLPFNSELPSLDKEDQRDRGQEEQEVTQEDIRGIKLDLVVIPAGSFLMGSEDGYDDEKPCHEVNVSQFLIGKYAVTQEQWRAVTKLPKAKIDLDDPDPSRFKGKMRPVTYVSWYKAKEFCDRLSQETGKEYRLPTEAEWEYACRAGTTTPFHFGETLNSDLANYGCQIIGNKKEQDLRHTTEVGSFKVANAFGLYDMHGNVWEWCLDYWHDDYTEAPVDGSAWTNANNGKDNLRVLRGGGWGNQEKDCRSANRHCDEPASFSYEVGFRVVCKSVIAPKIEEGRQKTEKSKKIVPPPYIDLQCAIDIDDDILNLCNLLANYKWREADIETYNLMCKAIGKTRQNGLTSEDINSFPCDVLCIIDKIWLYYSDARFSFTTQRNIFQELGGNPAEYKEDIWYRFAVCIGHRNENGKWLGFYDMEHSIIAPPGHLPHGGELSMFRFSLFTRLNNCNC